jgi:hypothetical protein
MSSLLNNLNLENYPTQPLTSAISRNTLRTGLKPTRNQMLNRSQALHTDGNLTSTYTPLLGKWLWRILPPMTFSVYLTA